MPRRYTGIPAGLHRGISRIPPAFPPCAPWLRFWAFLDTFSAHPSRTCIRAAPPRVPFASAGERGPFGFYPSCQAGPPAAPGLTSKGTKNEPRTPLPGGLLLQFGRDSPSKGSSCPDVSYRRDLDLVLNLAIIGPRPYQEQPRIRPGMAHFPGRTAKAFRSRVRNSLSNPLKRLGETIPID